MTVGGLTEEPQSLSNGEEDSPVAGHVVGRELVAQKVVLQTGGTAPCPCELGCSRFQGEESQAQPEERFTRLLCPQELLQDPHPSSGNKADKDRPYSFSSE